MEKKIKNKEHEKNLTIDFNVILNYIGDCGRYQLFLALLTYFVWIPCGLHQVAAVFLAATPPFRCWIPGIDDNDYYINATSEEIANVTAKFLSPDLGNCHRYDYKIKNCTADISSCLNETSSSVVVSCDSYVFDHSVYKSTVVTEWGLVCDKSIVATVSTSVFYVGVLFGALIGGTVADAIGRIPTMVVAQIVGLVMGVSCSFSKNIFVFALLRFLIATCIMSSVIGGFVYVMEIIGGRMKTIVGIISQAGFTVGYIILTALAYRWRDWRSLEIALGLTSLPVLLIWFIMPKSPRWLFSKGRYEEGKEAVKLIANRNGVTLPENIWELAAVKKTKTKEKHTPRELFRLPKMRLVTLIVGWSWFVISLVYYGISLNIGALAGSDYVNNALSGVMEVVSYPIAIIMMEKFGRKLSLSALFFVGGVACLVATLAKAFSDVHPELDNFTTAMALLGRTGLAAAFTMIFNFTAELYPTVVRSTAVGWGSMCARVGSISTPFALYLQNTNPWLTGTIFGVFSLIAGVLSLLLPETKGVPMPDTLAAAEAFYRKQKLKSNPEKPSERSSNDDKVDEEKSPMI